MAVTIFRTAWVDDDGTGTTGTVINNAVKTALYNEIDGALAKVAQLAGGNGFSGNQTVNGTLTVTLNATFSGNPVGPYLVTVQHAVAGTGNLAGISVANDVNQSLFLASLSSIWTPSGDALASAGLVRASGPGGLSLSASDAAGAIRFYLGGQVERLRISASGDLLLNAPTNPFSGKLAIVTDLAVRVGITTQNTNPANTGNFQAFFNSANGVAGNIAQTGATTIAYGTTSDARLKDDAGRASDLAALRAVVVHDFTWKADGTRDRGVFAQETHARFPRAIMPGTDEVTETGQLARPWSTDYSKFVPDLIVGWQQHEAELAALREQLATLKGPGHE